jgi:signal transduction histidine kinase
MEPPMQHLYSPKFRAAVLVAGSRLALASFSLAAVWLDPTRPVQYVRLVQALLVVYTLHSIAVLAALWRARTPLPHSVPRHAIDLIVFSVCLYASAGASSPLFAFFAFLLVAGSLRWQWRGTLWTGAAMLLAFVATGLYGLFVHPGLFKLNEFIIGGVSLVVTAALLAELGLYEDRARREIRELATEPEADPADLDALVRALPRWAAHVMDSPRALIAWEESDEPWLCLASYDAGTGQSRYAREAPGVIEPLVADDLAGAHFLCRRAVDPTDPVLHTSPGGFKRWQGAPLHPLLRERFSVTSVLSVAFEAETARGRLFLFDKGRMTSDDLVVGEIVAHRIAHHLDRSYLLRRLAERAALEERLRLGRDLHDGALHALAGVALELESLLRMPKSALASSQDLLREMQRALEAEQRALRVVIGQLRTSRDSPDPSLRLSIRLQDLTERLERRPGFRVEWGVTDLDALPDQLANEIYLLLHEALVNAQRHSGASVVRVEAAARSGRIVLVVADNGRGFPFRGRYDLAALTALHVGPATLKERVALLKGSLTIASDEHGSWLEISLPNTPLEP